MSLTLNPMLTTNAAGQFSTTSDGAVQGTAQESPVDRFQLYTGVLAATETLPMWGGVGISENIPIVGSDGAQGSSIIRATSVTAGAAGQLSGFSVSDQTYAWLTTPQSFAPSAQAGMTVPHYRLGSRARVWLPIAPTLISLDGSVITSQVSWDYVNQQIVPYAAAYVANPITGATWASTSGGRTTFTVTNDLSAVLAATDVIEVTGVVSTGGTGVGYNGQFSVVSVTSTTIVVTQLSASSPGTYSSGGTVVAGGGALPVKILYISPSNNKLVKYDPTTGFVTYSPNGPTGATGLLALAQL